MEPRKTNDIFMDEKFPINGKSSLESFADSFNELFNMRRKVDCLIMQVNSGLDNGYEELISANQEMSSEAVEHLQMLKENLEKAINNAAAIYSIAELVRKYN